MVSSRPVAEQTYPRRGHIKPIADTNTIDEISQRNNNLLCIFKVLVTNCELVPNKMSYVFDSKEGELCCIRATAGTGKCRSVFAQAANSDA